MMFTDYELGIDEGPVEANDFDWENNFKDVYWPDVGAGPDEPPIAFKLRLGFACAGYRVMKVEEVETHPVVIVRAVRKDANRITDHRLFFRHIRDILRQAGFGVKRDELIVDQSGVRVLASFLWRNSPAQRSETMPVLEGEFDPIP